MAAINFICSMPTRASFFVKRNIELVCCILLLTWFYNSFNFFFNYETFYVPNALIIDHYFNLSIFGWLFLVGHYAAMRPWGKVTVSGFTGMFIITSVHIHYNLHSTFIVWVATIFLLIIIGYLFCLRHYFRELYKLK